MLVMLLVGGLFYTLGIIFYAAKKIPHNHGIWHLFVLAGSISHFLGFLLYGGSRMGYQIISVRENHRLLEPAIDYFAARWGIDRRIYEDCITHSLTTDSPLPRWYLMMEQEEIIGGFGLITNDFISRQDLFPWLCALYVEEHYRGRKLGSKLLEHGQTEAGRLGFGTIYLCTDHVGYYEKYGWSFLGNGFHPWGEESRIYASDTIPDSTK